MPIALFQQIVNRSFAASLIDSTQETTNVPVIREYFIISTDKFSENCLAFSDGIPTIAFFTNPASTVTVYWPDKTQNVCSAWLTSQYLENTRFKNIHGEELLVIRFNPEIFYRVFQVTASSLRRQRIWSLPAALGIHGQELLNLAQKESTLQGKLSAVRCLLHRLAVAPISNWLLGRALTLVENCKGQITVRRISEELNVNYKWLERSFHSHIGLTPKEYIRLQRFKHTYIDLIESKGKQRLFDIAIDNGYYDTGHMLKDLKHFAGTTQVPL